MAGLYRLGSRVLDCRAGSLMVIIIIIVMIMKVNVDNNVDDGFADDYLQY